MFIHRSILSTPTTLPIQTEDKQSIKLLGVFITSNLKWDFHVNYIRNKCHSRFYAIRVLKPLLSKHDLLNVYCLFVRSLLEYCSPLFVALNDKNNRVLNSIQNRCHNLICGFGHTCICLEDLQQRRHHAALTLYNKSASNSGNTLHQIIPHKICSKFLQLFSRTSKRFESFVPFTTALINNSLSRV